ncbi:MAG: carboxypeptidase-like regulatory domain-containing protein [Planctomycetaceae bacterium]|nr:carboxypeptidase-like regulatory domain-containing protein [Planctomycetaceae bacterium]
MMKTFKLFLILFALIFFHSGCNRTSLSGLVPVEGIVKYNGVPIGGATVVLVPFQSTEESRLATAITEPNGTFKMMTLDGIGALPGSYSVTFSKKNGNRKSFDGGRRPFNGGRATNPKTNNNV